MRVLSVISLVVLVFAAAALFGAEPTVSATSKYVPDSCITVVTISGIQTDQGVSWMIDSWIKSPRESPLRDLLKTFIPQEMSVAFFPAKQDAPMYLLAAMSLPKGAKPDKEKIENVIRLKPESAVQTLTHKGTTIGYTTGQKGPEDFGAYALLADTLIFATDADLLKAALDGPSVDKAPNYQKTRAQFPKAKDGLLFADNSGKKFAAFLGTLEKKWKMTLLLSSQYLEWMASSFDVVNSTRVSGSFVMVGTDASRIEEIRDDAEFLGEAFRRKFIAEKIGYTSKVEVKDKTVVLTFDIQGLEPLWKRLFEQGVLELFRPERPDSKG
jgi:hypothetical protein